MAEIRKTYLREHLFQPIEISFEKIVDAVKSIPAIIWLGIINVIIGYGYLLLPEGTIINRSLNSVNLEIVFIIMLVSTIIGIMWSLFTRKAKPWYKFLAVMLNLAAGIPWYFLLYMLIAIITF